MSWNSEPCIARPTFIDLNPIELRYDPFMISLDKCNEVCNAIGDISTKVCVSRETKNVIIKVFNIITSIYEAQKIVKHASLDCKCKFSSTNCNSNQNGIAILANASVKNKTCSRKIMGHIFVRMVIT